MGAFYGSVQQARQQLHLAIIFFVFITGHARMSHHITPPFTGIRR
jgi:hypothetical protein